MDYGLVVSFPDQSQAFTLGFEAGMLWRRIEAKEPDISVTTRIENREIIARMASASGLVVELTPSEIEGWDLTILTPEKPKLTLIRGGLKLI